MAIHAAGCHRPEPEYAESYQEQAAHDLAAALYYQRNGPARDEHGGRASAKKQSVPDRKPYGHADSPRTR
jgi:hypothetical protein